jgi:hypothetical protein
MTVGSLITQFHRARREHDWVSQLCWLRALARHGPDALARLRQSVGLTAREFATLAAVAAEPSYVFFARTLTLSHYRTALAARKLLAGDAARSQPSWWIGQARAMGWTPRQLAWALRHPAAVDARIQAAHAARRQLESQVLRFNHRHGRVTEPLVLAPGPLTQKGVS